MTVGGVSRLTVVRVPLDLVEQDTASLPEPNRTLVQRYIAIVRAVLRHDVAAMLAIVHPDGVRHANQKVSRDELRVEWKSAFQERDFTQFQLRDVLDLDKVEVKAKGDGRFRVSTKPKIKYVGKESL